MTLKFNFTHLPDTNHPQIQREPPALLQNYENVVPAFVAPDEIGDVVNDIDCMSDWYH